MRCAILRRWPGSGTYGWSSYRSAMARAPHDGEEGAAICHRCVCDTILRRLSLQPSRFSVAPGFSERSVYQARLIDFLHQVMLRPWYSSTIGGRSEKLDSPGHQKSGKPISRLSFTPRRFLGIRACRFLQSAGRVTCLYGHDLYEFWKVLISSYLPVCRRSCCYFHYRLVASP